MKCASAILLSVACLALQYFSTLSHKRHSSRKNVLNTECVFWFPVQLLSGTFLILRRSEQVMIKNIQWSSCKVHVILSDFNETWIFSIAYRKVLKYQISWKSVKWEPSCSLRTDRRKYERTEVTKLIVVFRNFVNASKFRFFTLCDTFFKTIF